MVDFQLSSEAPAQSLIDRARGAKNIIDGVFSGEGWKSMYRAKNNFFADSSLGGSSNIIRLTENEKKAAFNTLGATVALVAKETEPMLMFAMPSGRVPQTIIRPSHSAEVVLRFNGAESVVKNWTSTRAGANSPSSTIRVVEMDSRLKTEYNASSTRLLGANSTAASGKRFLLNAEGSQLRGANGKFVNTLENDLPDPTNLGRAELRQLGDGRWKIFGSGEPCTPEGTYNFVALDGKVYVGTGDAFQGHV